MLKIVVDTNLIVSAVITSHGNPARILELFRKNLIEVVISEEIATEIQKVLNYPKLGKGMDGVWKKLKGLLKGLKNFVSLSYPKRNLK